MDNYNKLQFMAKRLNDRFGEGTAFQIVTRLAEECGEVAEQVNHFEGTGVKKEKHGEPKVEKMTKELMDVMRCIMQLAIHYKIEKELEYTINKHYEKHQK